MKRFGNPLENNKIYYFNNMQSLQDIIKSVLYQETHKEAQSSITRKRDRQNNETQKECKEKLFQNVNYKIIGHGLYGEVTECGPRFEKRQSQPRTAKTRKIEEKEMEEHQMEKQQRCQRFALKKIAKKRRVLGKEYEYPKNSWVNEYGIMMHLRDTLNITCVPQVYDWWECPDYYYIKMQLLSNITLNDIVEKWKENPNITTEFSDNIFSKLYYFLEEIHKMNKEQIYNNDLHLNNILWDTTEEKFYMIDFGFCTVGKYYKHEHNENIINESNEEYADVAYIIDQLPPEWLEHISEPNLGGSSFKRKSLKKKSLKRTSLKMRRKSLKMRGKSLKKKSLKRKRKMN